MSEAKIVLPDVIGNTKSLLGQKLLVNSFDNKKAGYQGSMPSIQASKQSLDTKPSQIIPNNSTKQILDKQESNKQLEIQKNAKAEREEVPIPETNKIKPEADEEKVVND